MIRVLNLIYEKLGSWFEFFIDYQAYFRKEWREITTSFWNFLTFKGDLETIKFVKQKFSLDLDQKSAYGFTPLHFAATNGKMGVVRYLTENGANINAKSYSQWTPFHLAARLVRFHCAIFKLADYLKNTIQSIVIYAITIQDGGRSQTTFIRRGR